MLPLPCPIPLACLGMRLQDFFNLVDDDHSGSITRDELIQALLQVANRPENPIRTVERLQMEESRRRRVQEVSEGEGGGL